MPMPRSLQGLALLPVLLLALAAPALAGWETAHARTLTLEAPGPAILSLTVFGIEPGAQVGVEWALADGKVEIMPLGEDQGSGQASRVRLTPGEAVRILVDLQEGMEPGILFLALAEDSDQGAAAPIGLFGLRWAKQPSGLDYRESMLEDPWVLEEGKDGGLKLVRGTAAAGVETKAPGAGHGSAAGDSGCMRRMAESGRSFVDHWNSLESRERALELTTMRSGIYDKAATLSTCLLRLKTLLGELQGLTQGPEGAGATPAEAPEKLIQQVREIQKKSEALDGLFWKLHPEVLAAVDKVLAAGRAQIEVHDREIDALQQRAREAERETEQDLHLALQHRFWRQRDEARRWVERMERIRLTLEGDVAPGGRYAQVHGPILGATKAFLGAHVLAPALKAALEENEARRLDSERKRRDDLRQRRDAEASARREERKQEPGAAAPGAGAEAECKRVAASSEERKAAVDADWIAARERKQREREEDLLWKAELRAARVASDAFADAEHSMGTEAGAGAGGGAEASPWRGWSVQWHEQALKDLEQLDPASARAIRVCAGRVEQFPLGFSIRARLVKHVAGGQGGIYEMRPRGAGEMHRPLFIQDGEGLVILAIAPEGERYRKAFNQVLDEAAKLALAHRAGGGR